MATTALVVAVLLSAALAAVGTFFYRRLNSRIAHLLEQTSPRNIYAARFAPPQSDESDNTGLPITDVVGAWAAEMEAAGVRVTSQEMDLQRQMRMEAGL